MARTRPKRRRPTEDGHDTGRSGGYSHPVEEDTWAEQERQRAEEEIRQSRLRNSKAAHDIDARLRAKGITPPSRPT